MVKKELLLNYSAGHIKILKKNQEDKDKLVSVLKDRMNQLDTEFKTAEAEATKWKEEYSKIDKQVKSM